MATEVVDPSLKLASLQRQGFDLEAELEEKTRKLEKAQEKIRHIKKKLEVTEARLLKVCSCISEIR